jgi:phosphate transport system permease protein
MESQLDAGHTRSILDVRLRRQPDVAPDLAKRTRPGEAIIRVFLLFCGVLSIFTTIGIVVVLGRESLLFFSSGAVDLVEFFTAPRWQPQAGEFGIQPLLSATVTTSFVAMLVAIPLGLGAAIYLGEYARPNVRATLKPILEVLAGIPTVVYGYFALTFMTPLLRGIFGQDTVQIYNNASAGLVMGIMILPTVASMSEDALTAVPRALREASYGLGATKFETIIKVVLPAALSGIIAAFLLGVSRAVGETMIVALAAGAGPCVVGQSCFNPFMAGETMTGHIARISGGDLSYNSLDYNSLFAIGLTLFVFTLVLNLISRTISKRFREVYQ